MIWREHTATSRHRLWVVAMLTLALCLAVGMALGSSADAKKKKKSPSVFKAQVSPNAAIPDYSGTGKTTPLFSTITVGKKFKGKTVADVNVTGLQTTGSAANALSDLIFKLTAPNSRTIFLIGSQEGTLGGQNLGPLTIDDDSPVSVCDSDTANCRDPSKTLIRPFVGTANEQALKGAGSGGLRAFRGLAMKGTWTLTVLDVSSSPTLTSVLNSWGLQITAQKPVT